MGSLQGRGTPVWLTAAPNTKLSMCTTTPGVLSAFRKHFRRHTDSHMHHIYTHLDVTRTSR